MLSALFHASIAAGCLAAIVSAVASVLFLRTRNFSFDSVALAATEIGLLILAAGIAAGTIDRRIGGGQWWSWDAGLTSALVCFLLYAPYLMLRNAIEEPTRRASSAAVVSIFAIFDTPFIVAGVQRWLARTAIAVEFDQVIWWAVVLAIGAGLAIVRFRQEQRRRAEDAARRTSQEL